MHSMPVTPEENHSVFTFLATIVTPFLLEMGWDGGYSLGLHYAMV